MAVDDAGTVGLDGIEVQFGYTHDDEAAGLEASFGYGVTEDLQLEIGVSGSEDQAPSPDVEAVGFAASAKWVPLTNDEGLSAGVFLEIARDEANDDVTLDETTEAISVVTLTSWAFSWGLNAHVNLSHEWVDVEGAEESGYGWGVGADYAISPSLDVITEIFGSEHGKPDKAVGLRYVVQQGVKFSAAIGRGSDRTFGNAGVLLEF